MPNLLAISLGPVQDFIAASRKTRDLWFGSRLLSEASRAAAKAVQTAGATLIFPAADALARPTPIANKILAIVPSGEPSALADAAEATAQGLIHTSFDEAMARIAERGAADNVDQSLSRYQLKGFLEFYAAWVPFEADGAVGPNGRSAYAIARETVELLLAGRKALRDFDPAPDVDGAAKSSLDPSRETVLRTATGLVSWRNPLPVGARSALRVKGAEQLDAISLVKRHAEPQRFVSLSRIAIDPFIRRLAAATGHADALPELRRLADQIRDSSAVEFFHTGPGTGLSHYKDFPFDSQLFYDDGARDEELASSQKPIARQFFEEAQRRRRALDIPELPAYLAVLAADGDKMGAAISSLNTRAAHQGLSEQLTAFAARAVEITATHHGALVYSGGDDVLAFLPLDSALAGADELRREFSRIVRPAAGSVDVSLSVGIAIGHYGEHLQNLLVWARRAEQEAKAANGGARNALAVALHTRTGGETARTVVQSWTVDPVPFRWQQWVRWHRCEHIPDGAAYELETLDRELRPLWGPSPAAAVRDLRRREVARILGRKRAARGSQPIDTARAESMLALVGDDRDDLRRLVDELVISRRIAAAVDVARGPAKPEECSA